MTNTPVRAELVEAPREGFDRLSPNGMLCAAATGCKA